MAVHLLFEPPAGSEAYIPFPEPRHRDILQRLLAGPTPEERKRWGRQLAREEAKRRQKLGELVSRHALLVETHRDSVIVAALLEAHGPRVVVVDGRQYAECHGCPGYTSYDAFDEPFEGHHAWPCPTWNTIAERTGG